MKEKIVLSLLIVIGLFTITGCSNSKLNEISKKINNSESVKEYKNYGYVLHATPTKDTITITSKMDNKKSEVKFKLDGDILSNENLKIDDLMSALLLINGIGQTHRYKDGELSQNINTFTEDYEKYTLNNEGLELAIDDDKVSLKIDITKKIPLIDINKFYLKKDNLDIISQLIKDKKNGNQSGKIGNIGYDIFVGVDENTIQIGQDKKLSDSAYKSIITSLEVMYDEEIAKDFQKLYPKFVDGKKVAGIFTIEKDYKPEDQENSVFKDTEVVLVTIDNTKIKNIKK